MSLADIKKLVKKSWFDLDEEGKDFLLYSTRENGSVGEESPGRADIQEAKRLRKLIKEKHPEAKVGLEVVDEWVSITVNAKTQAVAAPYRSGRFDYEGADAGVTITQADSELRVRCYHPMENIGKRGATVEVWEYRLYQPRNGRNWASKMKKRLKPGLPLSQVLSAIRTTMLDAQRESVRRGDPYPTKAYEPYKRSLKGIDSTIPDPSSTETIEDRRGKDVSIKFLKPEVQITSLRSAKDAAKALGHHYITLKWNWAPKVASLAPELIRLRGLEAVMEKLDEASIKYTVNQYAEQLYASVGATMNRKTKQAVITALIEAGQPKLANVVAQKSHAASVAYLKKAGIWTSDGRAESIGQDPTWTSLYNHPTVKAKQAVISTLIKAGKAKLANAVANAVPAVEGRAASFKKGDRVKVAGRLGTVNKRFGAYYGVTLDGSKSSKAFPAHKLTAAKMVKATAFEKVSQFGKTLGTSKANPDLSYHVYDGEVMSMTPTGEMKYMGSWREFKASNVEYDTPSTISLSSDCDSLRIEGSEAFATRLYDALTTARGNKGDRDALQPKERDLCATQKDVCKGNLGLKRANMPQVPKKLMGKFLGMWKSKGTKVKGGKTAVGNLTPSQGEINEKKVLGMIEAAEAGKFSPMKDPILTSGDHYVVDGHHRWAAALLMDPNNKMTTIEIDAPIKDVLDAANNFEGVEQQGL